MIKLERKKENKNRQHTHERESIILVDLENNEFQKEKGSVKVLENNEFGKEKGTVNVDTEVKQPTPAKISEDKLVDENNTDQIETDDKEAADAVVD